MYKTAAPTPRQPRSLPTPRAEASGEDKVEGRVPSPHQPPRTRRDPTEARWGLWLSSGC